MIHGDLGTIQFEQNRPPALLVTTYSMSIYPVLVMDGGVSVIVQALIIIIKS